MTVHANSRCRLLLGFISLIILAPPRSQASPPEQSVDDFDVVIAGGTTASFAAAIASADSGAKTCLIEPTDWVGGQLTASAVPAVDEAWHRIADRATGRVELDVSAIARRRENMTPNFRAMLDATGNPGHGWVSNYCFEPKEFLRRHLLPVEQSLVATGRLVVYRETVVKRVETDSKTGRITAIVAIQRVPKSATPSAGYDRPPSRDLADWYSSEPSARFDKSTLRFVARPAQKEGRSTVFIDATEWGEVLVLARASYLQGVESVDGGREGNDRCGQSVVFDFVERLNPQPVDELPGPIAVEGLGFGDYEGKKDAWSLIWTYRRIRSKGGPPQPGDLCLQNWGYSARKLHGGNDYPFAYFFKSKADAEFERADWRGGVDLNVLAAAEQRALGWHEWFKAHAPEGIAPRQITLDRDVLGTGHGLAKLPYIRDTRRSVGLDGFLLTIADLSGPAARRTGKRFHDRVAIGAYPADIHPVTTCEMPAYISAGHTTLPFFIPFRALTSESHGNLLVAGKTMAQSFLANAATRLHPIEWSSGTAAGVAAAEMAKHGRTSRQQLERIESLRALIQKKTPTEWTIGAETIPNAQFPVER